MLDHTGWASKYYVYLLCECEKGASLDKSYTCKLITNEKYKDLYNNLLTYFNMKKSRHKMRARQTSILMTNIRSGVVFTTVVCHTCITYHSPIALKVSILTHSTGGVEL